MIGAFYIEQVIMTYISADCRELQTDHTIEAVLASVRVDYCSICGIYNNCLFEISCRG